jgi:serine/threonine protein kinase
VSGTLSLADFRRRNEVVPGSGDYAELRKLRECRVVMYSLRTDARRLRVVRQHVDPTHPRAILTPAVDMWSVGCILAELLGGKPIFRGDDYVDQLNKILAYLGTPTEETLGRVGSPRAQEWVYFLYTPLLDVLTQYSYIRSLPIRPRIQFSSLYPNAGRDAIDLLQRMLTFDPAKRIGCQEALDHP